MSNYTINEDTARRANDLRSFRDYKPGSATAGYRAQVEEAADTLKRVQALCQTDAQRERAEYLFDRYVVYKDSMDTNDLAQKESVSGE